MKKTVSLILTILLVISLTITASAYGFSITVPSYYDKISEYEWYTDEFIANEDPVSVRITIDFEEQTNSSDEAFLKAVLLNVKNEAEDEAGFKSFISKPKITSTNYGYICITTSYEIEKNSNSECVVLFYFFSDDEVCEVKFEASSGLFAVSYSADHIVDSLTFKSDYYMTEESYESDDYAEYISKDNDNESSDKTGLVFIIIIISAVTIFGLYEISKFIYWRSDHGKWSKDAEPSFFAKITDISFEEKNFGYFTIIVFSDGYIFKTAKIQKATDVDLKAFNDYVIDFHNEAVEKYKSNI